MAFLFTMKTTEILTQLIAKGGLIGMCAKKYLENEALGIEFIYECYQQCHNTTAQKFWGEKLVKEIENFCLHNKNEASGILPQQSHNITP